MSWDDPVGQPFSKVSNESEVLVKLALGFLNPTPNRRGGRVVNGASPFPPCYMEVQEPP